MWHICDLSLALTTSSNQRLWQCVRRRINVVVYRLYTDTLNDFPSWLPTSKNQPFFMNNRGFYTERYFSIMLLNLKIPQQKIPTLPLRSRAHWKKDRQSLRPPHVLTCSSRWGGSLYDFSQQSGWFSIVLHLYKVTCRPANVSLLVNYGLRSAQRNNLFSQGSR